jgi:hypothetical protein
MEKTRMILVECSKLHQEEGREEQVGVEALFSFIISYIVFKPRVWLKRTSTKAP